MREREGGGGFGEKVVFKYVQILKEFDVFISKLIFLMVILFLTMIRNIRISWIQVASFLKCPQAMINSRTIKGGKNRFVLEKPAF